MSQAQSSVTTQARDGINFQVLRELSSGSEVWVIPDTGVSCVQFTTQVDGQPLEVIQMPESWDAFRGHPTLWGTGVLFPFPGRIRGGVFEFGGETYHLPLNEANGANAIHGCVSGEAWKLIGTEADDRGARATYQIGTDTHPHLNERYPFPFRLTLQIRLEGGRLLHSFVAENLGSQPMPVGLGLHPYFPLPFGGSGTVDDCEIWVDAPYYWEQEQAFPVGAPRRVEETLNLNTPRSLRALASVGIGGVDKALNVLYCQFSDSGAPRPSTQGIRAGVRNPVSGREVIVEADQGFAACVTFVPPSRNKVSFEPHTCVPNAFNVVKAGHPAGTITLGPREFWRGTMSIRAGKIEA